MIKTHSQHSQAISVLAVRLVVRKRRNEEKGLAGTGQFALRCGIHDPPTSLGTREAPPRLIAAAQGRTVLFLARMTPCGQRPTPRRHIIRLTTNALKESPVLPMHPIHRILVATELPQRIARSEFFACAAHFGATVSIVTSNIVRHSFRRLPPRRRSMKYRMVSTACSVAAT